MRKKARLKYIAHAKELIKFLKVIEQSKERDETLAALFDMIDAIENIHHLSQAIINDSFGLKDEHVQEIFESAFLLIKKHYDLDR